MKREVKKESVALLSSACFSLKLENVSNQPIPLILLNKAAILENIDSKFYPDKNIRQISLNLIFTAL